MSRIDNHFVSAVDILYDCKGRVVVTGMGKSGIIGKKIAATLASTGTPALYLHPAEGIHGDLGMVTRGDVVIAISNSGETPEIVSILPFLKRFGVKLIVMAGNEKSTLAKMGDVMINIRVKEEACPMNLVPTASTTAALAMGDALAVALLEKRGFKKEDFVLLHPGGTLGKRLILRVSDVMHRGADIPIVTAETSMKDLIFVITSKKLGIAAVVNKNKKLIGVFTDGDLRRSLERETDIFKKRAGDVMIKNPKAITADAMAAKAVQIMERYSITALPVVDKRNIIEGIIHLHDLLKIGVV
ncbi:MAG: KpsF/GutQ family sugar-phosphate isomerase [Nitrospirota bacterium]